MAEGLRCVRDLGVADEDAVVTGGAARHDLWMDALTLAMPSLRLHVAEPAGGSALGAALLGLSAGGADLGELVRTGVAHESLHRPGLEDDDYAAVASGYERYLELAATSGDPMREETP
jgi:sugar (pentulose or hexulose) kinase